MSLNPFEDLFFLLLEFLVGNNAVLFKLVKLLYGVCGSLRVVHKGGRSACGRRFCDLAPSLALLCKVLKDYTPSEKDKKSCEDKEYYRHKLRGRENESRVSSVVAAPEFENESERAVYEAIYLYVVMLELLIKGDHNDKENYLEKRLDKLCRENGYALVYRLYGITLANRVGGRVDVGVCVSCAASRREHDTEP